LPIEKTAQPFNVEQKFSLLNNLLHL